MALNRRRLAYFVEVAEAGQITRAARKLHIAQPALSQAITTLESELGFSLFDRHPRGVTLTSAGAEFLHNARRVVDAEVEILRLADTLSRGVRGAVRFGYVGLPPWQSAPRLIETFAEVCPDVEVTLKPIELPSPPASSWLAQVDVAVTTAPLGDTDGTWAVPMDEGPLVVLLPRGHRLAGRAELQVQDVLDEPFIGFDAAVDPTWAGFWSLDRARGGPPRQHAAKPTSNVQERLTLVASGRGITTAPGAHASVISGNLPGVVAVPLEDGVCVVTSLVGRDDRRSPAVEALAEVAERVRPVAESA